jgi:thermitase
VSRALAATALAVAALAVAATPAAARAPLAVGVIDSGVGAADATGHGSAVAATLRGALGPGVRARIASYPDLNRAGFAQPRLLARAIRRAAADGVRVVNVSQTIRGAAPRVRRAIAAAPETLFVVAAGNEGLDLDRLRLDRDPCTAPSPNVICVAATARDGELARTSNRGCDSVDVAALGPATSFAAPRVAARAATLLWHHPDWGGEELREATVAQLLTSCPSSLAS